MPDFTPWQLLVDFGFAALLLLCGQLVRSTVGLAQRLFLPAGVIGGFLGLALGPNGVSVVPMSTAISIYPGLLIALVFATLPFSSARVAFASLSRRVADLWSFSCVAILLQWGVGILLTLGVLKILWTELNPGFGALIAAGFVGGHGAAAAIGESFRALGWPEAGSLAMTAATVGILSAIIGGMIWIKWGARSGHTVLDLGTGAGLLLPRLLEKAEQVIAVDSSTKMLEMARHTAGNQAGRCDFRLGDLAHLPVANGEVEAVMACMVLHHLSNPAATIAEAHRALKAGGELFIVDLCKHEDESFRESQADLWLGFEPTEIERWLRTHDFDLLDADTACDTGDSHQLITFRGRKK